ncbi:hypothetical protein FA13DRAFT_1795220 [Coprinellus micaceus]|uniref:40S ribosomal protein S17 n=1 Tax=Coprinellus micaceus TaxID=71717 RepID=A0A4Y7SZB4_COPMI|nr:hypothetical protein FA13DRAFT_1795220 [Coprinellus micaceus]
MNYLEEELGISHRSALARSLLSVAAIVCTVVESLHHGRQKCWLAVGHSVLTGRQGRVRTKTVKRASRVLIEKYYPRLTLDFHTNKRIIDEVAVVPSKRLRNKISGFTTHLMKRIQKGPVRGISFKLQEEERERKDNYVPEVSALDTSATGLEVDPDTKALLESLNFDNIAVNVVVPVTAVPERSGRRERRNVPGAGRS